MKFCTVTLLLILGPGSVLSQTQTRATIISGNISNYEASVGQLRGYPDAVNHAIKLTDGKFSDTTEVVPGIFEIDLGKEFASIYLEPGFDLNISVDMNEFDESISFTGRGAAENRFLSEFYLSQEDFTTKLFSGKTLTEADFVRESTIFYKGELQKLHDLKEVGEQFIKLATKYIELEKIAAYGNFPYRMMQISGKEFQVSDSFADPVLSLDANDPAFLVIPSYANTVTLLVYKHIGEYMKSHPEINPNYLYLDILDTLVSNRIVKDRIVKKEYGNIIDYAHDKEMVKKKLMSMTDNDETRERIQKRFDQWSKLAKGNPSPGFRFADINGREYSLDDLRGKIVYIDVWATWCGPCKFEIPELKKLTAGFKDKEIAFVSICVFDNKEKWAAMVKEEKLDGIQLFNPDDKHDFIKSYNINGIPRFILLDREGKIIDANAARPSNPELKKSLESLL